MYHWCKNEAITAERLNLSQTRPYMEAVNKSGVDGGIDVTAVDTDCVLACFNDCDPGSVEPVSRMEISEHETGNLRYGWNSEGVLPCGVGMGRWQLESGASGVTGQEQYGAGTPSWVDNCYFLSAGCTVQVWDKITTNMWGTPTAVCRIYDYCCSHNTEIWNPSACEGGTVWRHMGRVERNCSAVTGDREPGNEDTHIWCAVNFNNAVIMPVARPVGRSHWDSICISQSGAPDDYCRYSKAHYTPIAGNVTGNTEPILSIGELGGTVVKLVNACGDQQGIGIASGIEIYDCESYRACYNSDDPRPKFLRAAKATFNGGGWVQLEPIKNQKHGPMAPWQFKLTAGGGGGWCDLELAHAENCYYEYSEYIQTWNSEPELLCHTCGIVWGDVRRFTGGAVCRHENAATPCLQFKPGRVKCGHIGIGTATWNDPGSDPDRSTSRWFNRQGGLVTGIVEDIGAGCSLRPYIDRQGIIHVRSMECYDCGAGRYSPGGGGGSVVRTGRYTTAPLNYAAAGVTGFGWAQYVNPPVIEAQRCVGVLTGDVERVIGLTKCVAEKDLCLEYRAGIITCGKIGIGTAHYAWKTDYNPEKPYCGFLCVNSSGGLIIGIKNDSTCRWYIEDGIIHTPNPCWMGEHGVNVPCADAYIADPGGGKTSAYVFPSPVYDGFWVTCSTGKVNGKVATISLNPDAMPTSWAPAQEQGKISIYTSYVLGEVSCGTIGIPTAFDKHVTIQSGTLKCVYIPQYWKCPVAEYWQPAGGLIRGVRMDIPSAEMPNTTCHKVFYGPIQLPFIDGWGILHLPSMYFERDCSGCSSWRPHETSRGNGVPCYLCVKKGPHDDPGPIPPPPPVP